MNLTAGAPDLPAGDRLAPTSLLLETRHDPKQRALAGAVRAEDPDLRAGQEGEPNTAQHLAIGRIHLPQVLHREDVLMSHDDPAGERAVRNGRFVLYDAVVAFKRLPMPGAARCWWATTDPLYQAYHDREWGRPVTHDHRLYEKLVLEGFQAGLSWLTILRKRPHFRAAFAGFDPRVVARFGARDVRRLLADAGIIRHRGKIEAAVENARRVLEVQRELGSFATYVWRFAPPGGAAPASRVDIASETDASRALARDLKARGFRFVGPTTVYAFMQAMGLVNDHLEGCWVRDAAERSRRSPCARLASLSDAERAQRRDAMDSRRGGRSRGPSPA